MMIKISKVLYWVILRVVFFALGYYGLVVGIPWARRGFLFLFWLPVVLSFFVLNEDLRNAFAKVPKHVPYFVDSTVDFAVCIILVCLNHWVLMIFWLWCWVATALVEDRRKELKNRKPMEA